MDYQVAAWAGDQEAQRTQAGRDHCRVPQSSRVTWLRQALRVARGASATQSAKQSKQSRLCRGHLDAWVLWLYEDQIENMHIERRTSKYEHEKHQKAFQSIP